MATRKPIVIGDDGLPQLLQAGDDIGIASTTDLSIRSMVNGEASAALVIGTPVYVSAAGAVKRAQANAASTSGVVGLCNDVSIAAAASGYIATGGVFVATTAQWDAVTGQTGGLTFGALYFLETATPGMLTTTPATTAGQCNVLVGRALSTTELDLDPRDQILL